MNMNTKPMEKLLFLSLLVAATAVTAQAQTTYTWNSPTTGTVNWSAASWNPVSPPVGGAPGNQLNFANGTYTANNDLAGTYLLGQLYINNGAGAVTLEGDDLEYTNNGDVRLVNNSSGELTVSNNITLDGPDNWYISPGVSSIILDGVISGSVGGSIFVTDTAGSVTFANANNSFTCPVGVNNEGALIATVDAPNGDNGAFGNSTNYIMLPNASGQNTTVGLYGNGGVNRVTIGRRINAQNPMGASGTRIIGDLSSQNWLELANYIDGPDNQTLIFQSVSGGGVQLDDDGVIGAEGGRTTSIIYDGGNGGNFSIYAAGGTGPTNLTYAGSTTLRSGYLILHHDDTASGAGTKSYSLGSSPVTTAVQLGDALTPSGAPISLLPSDNYPITINHNIVVNNYGGTTVIGSGSTYAAHFAGSIVLNKTVLLQDYTAHSDSTTFSGQISGSGGITTGGNGTVALQTNNTYTGGTTVNSGTWIDAQADGALGTGGIYVQSGAELLLDSGVNNTYINSSASLLLEDNTALVALNFTGTDAIAGLSFDGGNTWSANGTWGAVGSGAAHTSDSLSGTGFFLVNNSASANSTTNSLAQVLNAAYAPGLPVDGTGAAWAKLASSTLYMDTKANSVITNSYLGVNIRYAWDYTNLFILVVENTNWVVSTNEQEAPDASTYQANPWSFDGIAFFVDLNNTCGLTNHGVEIVKNNGDFQPWFGFSSASVPDLYYARANDSTTEDLAGLANAKVFTSGTYAAHNRKIEVAIFWADVAADVATNAQPGGNLAAKVAPGLKLGSEPLLINNYYNGQSFIGAGNEWNPPSGADTNSVDVQLVSLTTPPSLTVLLENGKTVVRWPSAALGYYLYSSPTLGSNAVWTTVGTAPVADSSNPGMLKVTATPTSSMLFYRLISN
jgi:autotransporter-associated beta strand protein